MRLGRLREGNVTSSRTSSATSSGAIFQSAPVRRPRPPKPVATEPGHDVADADVVVADLLHQRLAECVEPCLRRAVCRAADKRIFTGQAADVDDPSAASALEVRQRRATAVEDSAQVRVDHVLPVRRGHVGNVANRPTPALLTSTSSPPNCLTAASTAAPGIGSIPDIGADAEHRPCRKAGRGAIQVLSDRGRRLPRGRRVPPTRCAMASPMPRDPPVTTATVDRAARLQPHVLASFAMTLE